ncbi:MAG: glycosyltransferase family 87 protein [Haloarculaceae archaeon]
MSLLASLWKRRRDHPRLVAAALLLGILLLAYPFVDYWLRDVGIASPFRFFDFGAYRGTVGRWHAGEPIYVPNEDGGYHGTYLYPPFTLWVFEPFTELFEFRDGAMVWQAVSVALLWFGLDGLASSLGARMAWWERGLLLPALLGFHPLCSR